MVESTLCLYFIAFVDFGISWTFLVDKKAYIKEKVESVMYVDNILMSNSTKYYESRSYPMIFSATAVKQKCQVDFIAKRGKRLKYVRSYKCKCHNKAGTGKGKDWQ